MSNRSLLRAAVVSFILLLLLAPTESYTQIITTIAGTGIYGYTGDGGPATSAKVSYVWHVQVDHIGNIYFSDNGNSSIRRVDGAGIITRCAGTGTAGFSGDGGPATAARLAGVSGIAFDTSGNIYFSDANNFRIRRIDNSGIITTFAGNGIMGFSGDGGQATAASLNGPMGIAISTNNQLYFSDANNARIRKIDLGTGVISTIAGNGTPGTSGDGGPATTAQINSPEGIAFDASGRLYIADWGDNRIRMIDTSGVIHTVAGTGTATFGGDGGPASSATLNNPYGIAAAFDGALYISDHGNSRIRKIGPGPGDTVITIAGTGTDGYGGDGGPATAANIYWPNGITVDGQGNIYFADWHNYRIRRISTLNRAPWFVNGASVYLVACAEFNATDTLLQASDSNRYQVISWSVANPPAHGTAVVNYSTTATGSLITPTGTGYTPAPGYTGPDTFSVRITDGAMSDTIVVIVTALPVPVAAPLNGKDTLCTGDTTTLVAPPGGTWSISGSATVSGSGTVTAGGAGTATVTYTVTNACGTATATHDMVILPAGDCPSGVKEHNGVAEINILPNPNSGNFILQLPTSEVWRVVITDVTGRAVKETTATGTTSITLEAAPGLYFVRVESRDGSKTLKVMLY